jgi:hypothetical protein
MTGWLCSVNVAVLVGLVSSESALCLRVPFGLLQQVGGRLQIEVLVLVLKLLMLMVELDLGGLFMVDRHVDVFLVGVVQLHEKKKDTIKGVI